MCHLSMMRSELSHVLFRSRTRERPSTNEKVRRDGTVGIPGSAFEKSCSSSRCTQEDAATPALVSMASAYPDYS